MTRRIALRQSVIGLALLSVGSCQGGSSFESQVPWTNRTTGTAAASLGWRDVASDSTGTHLVAVEIDSLSNGSDADVWASGDGGASWTNRTKGTAASGRPWGTVASDASGTQLVAAGLIGGATDRGTVEVWMSADAGATWTKRLSAPFTAGGLVAPSVASDGTGAHVVVAAGDMWTSSDFGATWKDQTAGTSAAAQTWIDLASDSTGASLVAATAYGDLWTSSDFGATWANRTNGTAATAQQWAAVASDATGARLVAVSQISVTAAGALDGGDVWTSADAGAIWTNRTKGTSATGLEWAAVASDATGSQLVAASAHGKGNDVWRSLDSGSTWTNETAKTPASGQQWTALASDASGTHVVAVTSDPSFAGSSGSTPCCFGDIWTR